MKQMTHTPKPSTYSIPPLSELLKIQAVAAEQTPLGWRSILCRATGEMLLFALKLPIYEKSEIIRSARMHHDTQKGAMDYAMRIADRYNRFVKGIDYER